MKTYNSKEIIGIKEGKLYPFHSIRDAERKLRSRGFGISERNIRHCLKGERKTLCGFRWFYADDVEKYRDLILHI